MGTALIVVGVDGSGGGRRALGWALEHAARTGGTVRAVTVWDPDGGRSGAGASKDPDELRAAAGKTAAEDVGTALDRLGRRVPVEVVVRDGVPARVLTGEASRAALLVLGSHGHSRLYHAVLGSVSEECVRAASCPVVVVPTR